MTGKRESRDVTLCYTPQKQWPSLDRLQPEGPRSKARPLFKKHCWLKKKPRTSMAATNGGRRSRKRIRTTLAEQLVNKLEPKELAHMRDKVLELEERGSMITRGGQSEGTG
jgi:hypothetical protein